MTDVTSLQDGWIGLLSFVSTVLLSTLILFLLSSSVSLSNFYLAVPMRGCLGKHSCMSSPFPIAILNATCSLLALNYVIIKKIMETGLGFRNEKIYVPALFQADDGMLMATSVREMERMIKVLVEVAGRSGLCIIGKSKSMIFRRGRRENVERIGEIEVVHELKYLGDCYKLQYTMLQET